MLEPQTISIIIAAISVVVGVILSFISIRNIQITRKASLFMQIYNRFYDEGFHKTVLLLRSLKFENYSDFMKKYGPDTNPDVFLAVSSVGAYFAGIGLLVKRKLIDLGLVDNLLGDLIVGTWKCFIPIVNNLKEDSTRPFIVHWVEYLVNLLEATKPG